MASVSRRSFARSVTERMYLIPPLPAEEAEVQEEERLQVAGWRVQTGSRIKRIDNTRYLDTISLANK